MEAISHAGTSLGVLASDGVVLAAEKKIASKLLEPSRSSEKIFVLNESVPFSAFLTHPVWFWRLIHSPCVS